ncbi:MAG TPA: NosD domain-containing protein [Vicinamibacterales bacterium]|nr:NosD domain-containing protein [Vicinamibacterales bacterium]
MKRALVTAVVAVLLLAGTGIRAAQAEDISGTITVTKVIFENSRLVGDVTCTMTDGPCIDFGAPNIRLWLNGYTITGAADPDAPPDPLDPTAFCNASSGPPPADGIRIFNQVGGQILGPGIVQRFRRHGILIVGTIGTPTRAKVTLVTSHHNCFSGLLTNRMSDSVIEEIVSVRNANNSLGAPCGGNCLVNSHNNRIRRSVFGGNGSVLGPAGNNDFGIGLLFGSSGNLVEDNAIAGNTNGILIQASASGNVIRRNVIAGNPPGQVSRDYGPDIGFDIRDDSLVAGDGARNTFFRNWCVTYSGPGPAVCPSLPGPPHGSDD